jgi:hypothetical protein
MLRKNPCLHPAGKKFFARSPENIIDMMNHELVVF